MAHDTHTQRDRQKPAVPYDSPRFGAEPPSTGPSVTAVRVSQLIVLSLVMGVLIFIAVIELIVKPAPPSTTQAPPADLMLMAAGAALLLGLAVSMFIPKRLLLNAARNARTQDEVRDAITPAYVTASVLRGALLEGPSLFGAVVVFLTGDRLGYVIAAIGLLALLISLPTRDRLEALVESITETTLGRR